MPSLPETMTFIAHGAGGGPEVLVPSTGPVPKPAADEVLIRVMAAGVNRPDVAQRGGSYPPPKGASPIIGLEVAGEVVATGAEATRYKVGDRVCALTNGGGYAEYAVAPEAQTLPWPDGFDAIRAAALPETFFTVWVNLFVHGRLQAGETVLVHGGTSGIGSTALQLARALSAKPYATAGSPEKVAACLEFGAVEAFDYRSQDFVEEMKRVTGPKGTDVVLDMLGAPYFQRNLRVLGMDGRLVIIATMGGNEVEKADIRPIMLKRLVVTGSTMRPRTTAEKGAIARALEEKVWPLLSTGRVAPRVHETFALAEAAAAHRLMESSAHIGKIVLALG
ncbi:NAD(P)H-quinone oxidoreductase [Roseomonas sp. KE2513]|uniref:NAD(P)H-quinone oxidoreductase n=1 Tax=Roseomonas sp. KE2513 TaxID=2479202 RepID=UPI0018DFD795|nr:NAD(P)H-quinone oxidoreductase [Roseomonas sp. KE2513]MBI0537326.1 NAD(P)H-quinone oxidoreductase [Roseomonas sp. KE2513]